MTDEKKFYEDREAVDNLNRGVVEEFRANGGKVANFGGAVGTLLLLHTTGAKSGEPRLSPLASLNVDGKNIIVGSFGGSPKAPAWVHNLRANPAVHVEVGDESYDVTARELPEVERDAVFPRLVEIAPVFGDYQANTERKIPLFELIRAT